MEQIVYLNNKYIPLSEAHVSVMDRGFLLSDGIYEVIPIYNSQAFSASDHYQRLLQSLAKVNIDLTLSYENFVAIIETLIKYNQVSPIQNCYFQITRGASTERRQFEPNLTPTVFARLEISTRRKNLGIGIKVITVEDTRWTRCDIKGINRLSNVLMAQQVYFAKVDEAIIVKDGNAIEGISSNLFIVKKNTIITPPLSENLLSGVTRKIIIGLIKKCGYPLLEKVIPLNTLFSADEIWLTSSVIEVAIVDQINEKKVGLGINSIGATIQKKYTEYIDTLITSVITKK